ncbi:MAG: Gfo/Idh/MocA family oxidoreductase [Chitinophagales bacterium]
MSKIKFAVIGFGHIGKRHATMIRQNPACELVAVCDIDEQQRKAAEADFQTAFYTQLDELFANHTNIDVVNVCSPNGFHAEHCLKALEHHCHVVCEKPMGLRKADCEAVIYKALNVSRQVFGVMQNRYSPPSVWLKEIVSNKVLGEIFMVQINCYWNRDDRYYSKSAWKGKLTLDGGPLFTQFSHFLDIMYWLFGDIAEVTARFQNFNHQHNTEFEDSGLVNFKFVQGGMGCINYSTSVWDTNLESSMTIIGQKGAVKVGGQYMDKVEYCHVENYTMPELAPVNPPNDYGSYKGSAANHHYVIQNVVDTLQGKSTITTNALEGMKVVEIIERIYALKKSA